MQKALFVVWFSDQSPSVLRLRRIAVTDRKYTSIKIQAYSDLLLTVFGPYLEMRLRVEPHPVKMQKNE